MPSASVEAVLRLWALLTEVAERTLPAGTLGELRTLVPGSGKVLQKLGAAAPIEARSGRIGGCALARSPRQITLAEMLAVGRPRPPQLWARDAFG
jgi:hypothetical protein